MKFKVLDISDSDDRKLLTGQARFNDFIEYVDDDLSASEAHEYINNLSNQAALEIVVTHSEHYLKLKKYGMMPLEKSQISSCGRI